jgi:hypothetical protein
MALDAIEAVNLWLLSLVNLTGLLWVNLPEQIFNC